MMPLADLERRWEVEAVEEEEEGREVVFPWRLSPVSSLR